MTKSESRNLVFISGGVVIAGTLLQHHYAMAQPSKSVSGQAKQQTKETFDLGKKLAPVGLIIVIMIILSDLVPDFAGPFALLVMVAYLATHMDVFNKFAKEQG